MLSHREISMQTQTTDLQTGDRVKGTYKGEAFLGEIVQSHQTENKDVVRFRVQFDWPLSMGSFKYFYTCKDGSAHQMTEYQCELLLSNTGD